MTIRNRFEREIETLNQDITLMGGMIERAIGSSVYALVTQNKDIAKQVIENENEINQTARQIESCALKILLRQQPVAGDLKIITTALKIVTDMERIGDQSEDICSIVLHLCDEEYQTKLIVIPKMADVAVHMVNMCIDSFVKMDITIAKKVIEMDNEVDDMFGKVKDNMINLIKAQPEYADQAIYLMMVAKYLEKIGDHAENIAEWVIFCKTGERKNVKII